MAESTYSVSAPTAQSSSVDAGASTARFVLSAGEFALATLFERVPDARVEVEPAIANATDHALLVVRADDHERSAVGTAIEMDDGTAAAEFLAEREGGWAYRVTWSGRPHRLVQRLVAEGVTVLSMRGQGGRWKLRLLASDREGISRAHELMGDLGCGPDCLSVSTVDGDRSNSSTLTDEQHEALVAAFETGYYDIPRDATAEAVATELGISHQALSERFRRAYRHIIETELVVTDEERI